MQPSKITLDGGSDAFDEVRTSRSALLSRSDPISQRIMKRTADLQGSGSNIDFIEDLQLTAYTQGQRYYPHYDWFDPSVGRLPGGFNRVSTIFATLDASCDGCGTRFPRLQIDWNKKDATWCKFMDCNDTEALTVKPVPGAALFWRNLNSSGLGEERTLHEGLPLPYGSKTGLHIWTRGRE